MPPYASLESIFTRWNALNNAASILHWDNATMMPSGAGDMRGEQLAVLAELAHETITQPVLGELFAGAEAQAGSLDEWQQANLREMKRVWRHATALPVELVSAMTKACHESELFWRTARKENNFKDFAPHQAKVLELVRESAQAKAAVLGLSPYDALLDQYDPGTRSTTIDTVFKDLAVFLPEFIQQVRERQASEVAPIEIHEPVPVSAQKALGIEFMKKVGFDFTHGRLDESVHPFCGGVPGDVRLTARYNEQDFLSGFFAVMHETGHALYEMGLPERWRNQPVGQARGMAFHESQSLLSEMQLCIRREFLEYSVPVIRGAFGVSGDAWTPDNIYRLMTRVQPSLIRVDADEVTYPAHVILRYRLERKLIGGELAVKDLPEAWREQMQGLLGIVPDSDANGCMQDIHWPDGTFGYFPTYTLGAMTAAQLFQAIEKAIPDLLAKIRSGEFAPLFAWLRANVHSLGSKLSSEELLKHATGEVLNTTYYKRHLQARYLTA
ncbi:MAG TPA: carboxypeptidase M32 [Rickettsiales bacterium]|nr:carboxypeptidase M32 [Rickettsiales bacterium]